MDNEHHHVNYDHCGDNCGDDNWKYNFNVEFIDCFTNKRNNNIIIGANGNFYSIAIAIYNVVNVIACNLDKSVKYFRLAATLGYCGSASVRCAQSIRYRRCCWRCGCEHYFADCYDSRLRFVVAKAPDSLTSAVAKGRQFIIA
jgi:hypothetical protein